MDFAWIFHGFLLDFSRASVHSGGFRWILLEKGGFCLKKVHFGTTFGENIFFGRRFFGSEGRFGHRRVCAVVSARFQEKKVDDRKYF